MNIHALFLRVWNISEKILETKQNKLLILFFILYAIYFRAPNLFSDPRFWAEEGTTFFTYSRSHGWIESLFHTQELEGYIEFFPNLATKLATLVPLKRAPLVTTSISFLLQIIPFVIILWSKSIFWSSSLKKIIGIIIILTTQLNQEVWLNSLNSTNHFLVINFLILLENHNEQNRTKIWAYRILLALGSVSRIQTCLLSPLYLLKAYQKRERNILILAGIVVSLTLVQFSLIVHHAFINGLPSGRAHSMDIIMYSCILWVRGIIVPFFGLNHGIFFNNLILKDINFWGISFIFTELVLFFYIWKDFSVEKKVIYGYCYFFISIILLSGSLGEKYHLIYPLNGPRYFYFNNILFMLIILDNITSTYNTLEKSLLIKKILSIFLFFGLWNSLLNFNVMIPVYSTGNSWKEEVIEWSKDSNYIIKIWPSGWTMALPKDSN